MLEVKGSRHKISKKAKPPGDAIPNMYARREKLSKEASLLSSFSKLMSPPMVKAQDKDNEEVTAEEIEAIIEQQENDNADKAALDA